jgi:two-component system, chemotaxis family, chemotaxis protein CheY
LLKTIFSAYGQCDLALDGSEALSNFHRAMDQDQPYDVIFLDVVMPGISGLETLDCIRQIESNYNIHGLDRVKVVIITGYDDPKLSVRSFRKDCETYLSKPFTPKQILDTVRDLSDIFQVTTAQK